VADSVANGGDANDGIEAPNESEKEAQNRAAHTEPPPPEPPSGLRRMWLEFWRVLPPAPLPRGKDKIRAIKRLDRFLRAQSPAVARFILAETKDQAEKKRAAHRTLEAKATSVIGFATAVLGFAAAFNSGALLKIMWFGSFPAIVPALLLEAGAIIAGIMALQTQSYELPDAVLFNYPDALEDPMNEARIAMALTQTWAHYEQCLTVGNATRSRRFTVALWMFVIGLFYSVGLAAGDVIVKSHSGNSTTTTSTASAPKNVCQTASQGKKIPVHVKVGSGTPPNRTNPKRGGTP
jgi:hypothetical protein